MKHINDLFKIYILLLAMLFLSNCALKPKPPKPGDSAEPNITYKEGKVLEPQPRGTPDPSLPLNPIKEKKAWDKMFSTKHHDFFDIIPGGENIFQVEITTQSMIFVKIYLYGEKTDQVSVKLFQQGQEEPVWVAKSLMLNNSLGYIKDEIEITEEMIVMETKWTFKILNSTNHSISVDVSVATIDLTKSPE